MHLSPTTVFKLVRKKANSMKAEIFLCTVASPKPTMSDKYRFKCSFVTWPKLLPHRLLTNCKYTFTMKRSAGYHLNQP